MSAIARVDRKQVSRVARHLRDDPPKTEALNFYSFPGPDGRPIRADAMYPDIDDPRALDFFFLGCLHDYGFWYGGERGYLEPMYGQMDNKIRKGSDLLWRLIKKELDRDPDFFRPHSLACVEPSALSHCLCDETGTQWPDFDHRLALSREWGKWLLENSLDPYAIVTLANQHERPLEQFLDILASSPFGRDEMRKKAVLLAMVLYNRPEKFLEVSEKDEWPAIVDYHLMRVSLRLGMVNIPLKKRSMANSARAWIPAYVETAIRDETRKAVEQLQKESGLTHGQIDNILWQARRFCPEMDEPECEKCLFSSVCEKRVELFQPVIRTTAY